jgi:carbon starvation protein
VAPQLIFNQRLDGWLTVLFTLILWFVILDMARICVRRLSGKAVNTSEAPYQPTKLETLTVGAGLQHAAQTGH